MTLEQTTSEPGQTATSSRPTSVRWEVFFLACGASFLLYLHRYTWNIVGPAVQNDFELSNTQAGLLFSLFYWTYASGQIPSGIIIDRFGPHRFLSAIAFAWSISLAALGTTSQLVMLGLWRFVFGATQAGCYPALTQVTRRWFPARQRTVLQGWIATTSGRSGGAMSPIILATLLMGTCGLTWQQALAVMGLAGVAFAVLFFWRFRNSPEQHPGVNAAELALIQDGELPATTTTTAKYLPMARAMRNRSLRFFVVQQFLDAGADVVFVSLIGSYFLQARGLEMSKTGWLASLPLWGGALGGIMGGWLNDSLILRTGNRRWSRSGIGLAGKLIGCVMIGVVTWPENALAAGLMLMLAKFFGDWSQPTVWGTCTDLGGRYSATVFSIINTAGTLGGVVMPLIFGMVLDWATTKTLVAGETVTTTDWTPLFLLLAGMFLSSAICWIGIDCTMSLEREEN
ncbi:MFS transporter [bacterium]|nr:MFS transporter [bacterium]